MITIEAVGGEELQMQLELLPEKAQKQMVKHAMKKSSALLRDVAKRMVPKRTAALATAEWKIRVMRPRKGRIGIMVETPTREELAKFQPTKADMVNVLDGKGYYPTAQEYGSSHNPPHPFMRPAMDMLRELIIKIFLEDLKESILKANIKGATVT